MKKHKRRIAAMKVKLSFTRIVARAFRKHSPQILANITRNNLLFTQMKRKM